MKSKKMALWQAEKRLPGQMDGNRRILEVVYSRPDVARSCFLIHYAVRRSDGSCFSSSNTYGYASVREDGSVKITR